MAADERLLHSRRMRVSANSRRSCSWCGSLPRRRRDGWIRPRVVHCILSRSTRRASAPARDAARPDERRAAVARAPHRNGAGRCRNRSSGAPHRGRCERWSASALRPVRLRRRRFQYEMPVHVSRSTRSCVVRALCPTSMRSRLSRAPSVWTSRPSTPPIPSSGVGSRRSSGRTTLAGGAARGRARGDRRRPPRVVAGDAVDVCPVLAEELPPTEPRSCSRSRRGCTSRGIESLR